MHHFLLWCQYFSACCLHQDCLQVPPFSLPTSPSFHTLPPSLHQRRCTSSLPMHRVKLPPKHLVHSKDLTPASVMCGCPSPHRHPHNFSIYYYPSPRCNHQPLAAGLPNAPLCRGRHPHCAHHHTCRNVVHNHQHDQHCSCAYNSRPDLSLVLSSPTLNDYRSLPWINCNH